jgi:hypothetical protein
MSFDYAYLDSLSALSISQSLTFLIFSKYLLHIKCKRIREIRQGVKTRKGILASRLPLGN